MALLEQSLTDTTAQAEQPVLDDLFETGCPNPYDCTSEKLDVMTAVMCATMGDPFISSKTHPTILPDLSIYVVSGEDPLSNIARSIEGETIKEVWGHPPTKVEEDFAPIEDNSAFFILVENAPGYGDPSKPPRAIGTLRVAISNERGDPLESRSFYEERFDTFHPGETPPQQVADELDLKVGEQKLWDVVYVGVKKGDRRDGASSSWLYHSLYAMSQLDGVDRWIGNLHKAEFKSMQKAGIPFRQIEGSETMPYEFTPGNGETPRVVSFIFSVCDPAAIRASMEARMVELRGILENPESTKIQRQMATGLMYAVSVALNGVVELE